MYDHMNTHVRATTFPQKADSPCEALPLPLMSVTSCPFVSVMWPHLVFMHSRSQPVPLRFGDLPLLPCWGAWGRFSLEICIIVRVISEPPNSTHASIPGYMHSYILHQIRRARWSAFVRMSTRLEVLFSVSCILGVFVTLRPPPPPNIRLQCCPAARTAPGVTFTR